MKDFNILWAFEAKNYIYHMKKYSKGHDGRGWDESYLYYPTKEERNIIEKEINEIKHIIKNFILQMIPLSRDHGIQSLMEIDLNNFECSIKMWYDPTCNEVFFNIDHMYEGEIGKLVFEDIPSVDYI